MAQDAGYLGGYSGGCFELCDHTIGRKKPLPPLIGESGVISACREAAALITADGPGEWWLLSGTGYGWLEEYWRGVQIEDRLCARRATASRG